MIYLIQSFRIIIESNFYFHTCGNYYYVSVPVHADETAAMYILKKYDCDGSDGRNIYTFAKRGPVATDGRGLVIKDRRVSTAIDRRVSSSIGGRVFCCWRNEPRLLL